MKASRRAAGKSATRPANNGTEFWNDDYSITKLKRDLRARHGPAACVIRTMHRCKNRDCFKMKICKTQKQTVRVATVNTVVPTTNAASKNVSGISKNSWFVVLSGMNEVKAQKDQVVEFNKNLTKTEWRAKMIDQIHKFRPLIRCLIYRPRLAMDPDFVIPDWSGRTTLRFR